MKKTFIILLVSFGLLSVITGILIVNNFSTILEDPKLFIFPIAFLTAIGMVVWALRLRKKLI